MSKQVFIVEIEDGPDTKWIEPVANFRGRIQPVAEGVVSHMTEGQMPRVTVISEQNYPALR